jgi:carboxypeptidase family protein
MRRLRGLIPAVLILLLAMVGWQPTSVAFAGSVALASVADASINSASPSINYGSTSPLHVDGSPVVATYLRFNVTSTPAAAPVLSIYPTSSQSTGFDVHALSDDTWVESALTWNNRPAWDLAVLASSGPATANVRLNITLPTASVPSGGNVDFVLTTSSVTALALASRESANPPQLLVTASPPPSPTPSPSPVASPTPSPTPTPTPTPSPSPVPSPTPSPSPPPSPSPTPPPSPTPSPPPQDPIVLTAGDIACGLINTGGMSPGGACQQAATATLLGTVGAAAILPLGDNQYECGELSNFQTFYGPTWGQYKNLTYPVVGNHEYLTAGGATPCLSSQTQAGAPGYFTYFGSAASPLDAGCSSACRGYYSFDIGAWHLIALNANCGNAGVGGCGAGSPQETWLKADLAAHANRCTLAYWHQPRFTSGQEGDTVGLQAFWSDLYDAQVDLVLNGHDHDYERFTQLGKVATTDSAGLEQPVVDPNGIREIVVGTGGRNLTRFPAGFKTGSQVHDSATFGVLKLDLHASSYSWTFLPTGTGTFTDSGTTGCRFSAGPIDSTPPTSPAALQVIASPTKADLAWTAATDNVGVAAYRVLRGGTPLVTIPSANPSYTDTAVVTGQTYTYAVASIDAAGNVSPTSASVTVTIPAGSGSLAGIVTDSSSGLPVSGATVSDSAGSVTSDSSGHYSQTLPAASYIVTATASGFAPVNTSVTVVAGGSVTQNFALLPGGCITGQVIDANGLAPLAGATVSWVGGTTRTDAGGNYALAGLSDGSYTVTATLPGFTGQTRPVVTVAGGNCPTAGFSLTPDIFSDGFESGTFSAWNGGLANNTIVQTATLHTGGDAAEANVNNLAYSATRTLPSTYPMVYVRTYFRLHSKSTNVGIYRVRTAGAIDILHLYVDNATGQLGLRNDVTGLVVLSGHVVSADSWHSIETKVVINGTSSTIQVWLDGIDQTALDSTAANLGMANVGQVMIGDTNPRTVDAFWDDTAVADGRIGG